MGAYRFQREVSSYNAQSFAQNTRARDKDVLDSSKLQSRNQHHHGKLHLTQYELQQCAEMKQRAENMYSLEESNSVSRFGMAEDVDHTRLCSAPISGIQI